MLIGTAVTAGLLQPGIRPACGAAVCGASCLRPGCGRFAKSDLRIDGELKVCEVGELRARKQETIQLIFGILTESISDDQKINKKA